MTIPTFSEVSLDFLHALQDATTPEGLYRRGQGWGRRQAVWMRDGEERLKMGAALSRWSARLEAEGWGSCRFDLRGARRGEIRADVENSPLAQRAGAPGKAACSLLAGQFAGAFEELSQRPTHALEIACRSAGESKCRFLIGPAHWIDAERFWTHEGLIQEADPSSNPPDAEAREPIIRLSHAFWTGIDINSEDEDAGALERCGRRWSRSLSRRLERDFQAARGVAASSAPARVFKGFLAESLRRWGWGAFTLDESRCEHGVISLFADSEMPRASRSILTGALAGMFSQMAQADWNCVCEPSDAPEGGYRFQIAAVELRSDASNAAIQDQEMRR